MSGATAVEQAKQGAARVVRNLPGAHASWQYYWRNAAFRRAITELVDVLYAVEAATEDQLSALIDLADVAVKVIEIHSSRLGAGVRDVVDREYFAMLLERIAVAREGLERGLPADPTKRPTREQLLDRFAEMLRAEPLNLPDHRESARAGTA